MREKKPEEVIARVYGFCLYYDRSVIIIVIVIIMVKQTVSIQWLWVAFGCQ